MLKNYPTDFLFTSESVSEGHPDKICDQISDAIVDAFLAKDPHSRLGCEVMVTPDNVIIGGEIRSEHYISKEEISSIARNVIKDIGYEQQHFHWQRVNIHNYLITQSADIAMGVDSAGEKDEGA